MQCERYGFRRSLRVQGCGGKKRLAAGCAAHQPVSYTHLLLCFYRLDVEAELHHVLHETNVIASQRGATARTGSAPVRTSVKSWNTAMLTPRGCRARSRRTSAARWRAARSRRRRRFSCTCRARELHRVRQVRRLREGGDGWQRAAEREAKSTNDRKVTSTQPTQRDDAQKA